MKKHYDPKIKIMPEFEGRKLVEQYEDKICHVMIRTKLGDFDGFYQLENNVWDKYSVVILSSEQIVAALVKAKLL